MRQYNKAARFSESSGKTSQYIMVTNKATNSRFLFSLQLLVRYSALLLLFAASKSIFFSFSSIFPQLFQNLHWWYPPTQSNMCFMELQVCITLHSFYLRPHSGAGDMYKSKLPDSFSTEKNGQGDETKAIIIARNDVQTCQQMLLG